MNPASAHLSIYGGCITENVYRSREAPAFSYVQDTLHIFGIPQNWIVDAAGIVRLKGIGYDSTEKWEQGMIEAIESNKPEPATAAASGSGR